MTAPIGRVMATLTAGALLTACSSTPSPAPELTGVRTAVVDSMTVLTHWPRDMDVRDFHDRGLSGPHYTLGISWVATGHELHASDADTFGVRPVRAPDGKQLIIVAVSPKATSAPFQPAQPIHVEALVDKASTALTRLPLAEAPTNQPMTDKTELLLLSAPPQASLKLRVTDDSQAQELNLRTGASSGHGYQQWESKFDWAGTSPVALPPPLDSVPAALAVNNPFVVSTQYQGTGDHAYLTNYKNSRWAATGQLFLTLPVPRLDCSVICSPYHVTFDDATAFLFTPAGGKPTPAEPTSRDIPLAFVTTSSAPATVTVNVPDDITQGTVTFDLAKSRLVSNEGENKTWTRPPHAYTVNVTFTR